MKKILWLVFLLLFAGKAESAPTTTMSVPNSFSGGTTILSAEVNDNNSEIQDKFNTHSHEDITKVGTINTGTWSAGTVAITVGGTGQTTSHAAFTALAPLVTSGGIISFNGSYSEEITPNISGAVLMFQGGTYRTVFTDKIPITSMASGAVIQIKWNEVNKVASGTTAIPYDNTVPQDTEGDQYMALSFTPKMTTSYLKVDVASHFSNSGNNRIAVALFGQWSHSALAVGGSGDDGSADGIENISFTKYLTTATTATLTFSVRAGAAGATTTFNSQGGTSYWGNGSVPSSITISEIRG
jgi:hypothetical protein